MEAKYAGKGVMGPLRWNPKLVDDFSLIAEKTDSEEHVKERERRTPRMLIPTIVMGVIALLLLLVGYQRGAGQHIEGIKSAFNMTIEILPLLVFAFTIAGMTQALLPQQMCHRHYSALRFRAEAQSYPVLKF